MPKREDSSLILQNLKKRNLPALGRPVVPLEEAEAQLTGASDISSAILRASAPDSAAPATEPRTRLLPRRRVARSALLVRLDPELHRRLDDVARFNGLTMNDIVVEAIELHLGDFAQPPSSGALS
ncbi:MAG TPA: hypothetical protein VN442_26430 [Bryobacteraceae bacterium]|nr:hypothetical protein [Bryobacteraceae bacterium]